MRKYKLSVLCWAFAIVGLAGLLIVTLAPRPAKASQYHRNTTITEFVEVESTSGAAAAYSAAQIHFDWNTSKLQVGVGYGYYDGDSSLSLGIAQRFDEILLNGSTCGSDCVGLGATLRF